MSDIMKKLAEEDMAKCPKHEIPMSKLMNRLALGVHHGVSGMENTAHREANPAKKEGEENA